MNLNHVLKKVGRGRSHNLFSFNVFMNLHTLGYPKSVTIYFVAHGIWVKQSLSMMCNIYQGEDEGCSRHKHSIPTTAQ
jgi:hypothetical protein